MQDRSERISAVLGRPVDIIPYSNAKGYNLETLFTGLLSACAQQRKWIFHGIKGFSLENTIPQSVRELIGSDTRQHQHASRNDRPMEALERRPASASASGAESVRNKSSIQASPGLFAAAGSMISSMWPAVRISDQGRRLVRETIGRENIEQCPPTEEELVRLQARIKDEKRRTQ